MYPTVIANMNSPSTLHCLISKVRLQPRKLVFNKAESRPSARPWEPARKKRESRRARLSPKTSAKPLRQAFYFIFPVHGAKGPLLYVARYFRNMLQATDNTQAQLGMLLKQNLHTAITASRRAPDSGHIACARRSLRRDLLNVTLRVAANSNAHGISAGIFPAFEHDVPNAPHNTSFRRLYFYRSGFVNAWKE